MLQTTSPVSSRPAEPAASLRVIVVGTVGRSRRQVVAPLIARGYQVAEAADVDEAAHKHAAQPADLLILDVILPNLEGWEMGHALRRAPALCAIPSVILAPRLGESNLAALPPAASIIYKPYDVEQLLAAARDVCAPGDGGSGIGRHGSVSVRSVAIVAGPDINRY